VLVISQQTITVISVVVAVVKVVDADVDEDAISAKATSPKLVVTATTLDAVVDVVAVAAEVRAGDVVAAMGKVARTMNSNP